MIDESCQNGPNQCVRAFFDYDWLLTAATSNGADNDREPANAPRAHAPMIIEYVL